MKHKFKESSIIIELLGPPGSGKTSIAEALQKALTNEKFAAYLSSRILYDEFGEKLILNPNPFYIEKKFFKAKFFSLMDMLFFLPLLKLSYGDSNMLRDLQISRTLKLTYLVALAHQLYKRKFCEAGTILVSEPGWLMSFLNGAMYSVTKVDEKVIKRLVNHCPTTSLTVGLTIDPIVAINRLKIRPRGPPLRMMQIEEKKWIDIIRKSNTVVRQIVGEKNSNRADAAIMFDNSSDNYSDLLEEVLNFMRAKKLSKQ